MFFLGNGSNQQAVSDSYRVYVSKPPPMISNSLDSAVADHDPEPGMKSHGSVQLEIPSEEQKKKKPFQQFSVLLMDDPSQMEFQRKTPTP